DFVEPMRVLPAVRHEGFRREVEDMGDTRKVEITPGDVARFDCVGTYDVSRRPKSFHEISSHEAVCAGDQDRLRHTAGGYVCSGQIRRWPSRNRPAGLCRASILRKAAP